MSFQVRRRVSAAVVVARDRRDRERPAPPIAQTRVRARRERRRATARSSRSFSKISRATGLLAGADRAVRATLGSSIGERRRRSRGRGDRTRAASRARQRGLYTLDQLPLLRAIDRERGSDRRLRDGAQLEQELKILIWRQSERFADGPRSARVRRPADAQLRRLLAGELPPQVRIGGGGRSPWAARPSGRGPTCGDSGAGVLRACDPSAAGPPRLHKRRSSPISRRSSCGSTTSKAQAPPLTTGYESGRRSFSARCLTAWRRKERILL